MTQIITISGGPGSGKTTLIGDLASHYNREGVTVVGVDNYYKRFDDLTKHQRLFEVNRDVPDAFDFDLLNGHLGKLLQGEEVLGPKYIYATGSRKDAQIILMPNPVILVEGLYALGISQQSIHVYVDVSEEVLKRRNLQRIESSDRAGGVKEMGERLDRMVLPAFRKFNVGQKDKADFVFDGDIDLSETAYREEVQRLLAYLGGI